MVGGYAGKILEVNLSTGRVRKKPIEIGLAREYIGGRGLMNRLLWDMMEPGTPPFSEKNLFMLFTGPLSGVLISAPTVLRFKSPLTASTRGVNLIGHAVTSGQWGAELKFAGYDGLIVSGRSENPVYLYAKDEDVEIRGAKHLWGMTSSQTEVKVKEETDPFTRVLCIGPAGENLIRYASVEQEYFRAAARCGGGAVMGWKNLKAVAVRGSNDIPVENKEDTFKLYKSLLVSVGDPFRRYSRMRWGTTLGSVGASDRSHGPLKNWKESYWGDEVEKSSGIQWESRCRIKNRGCYGCPAPCMQLGVIRTGPYAGVVDSPDYDSTELIGPNCMITDHNGMFVLSSLCDELGFDAISAGNVLSWVMECYETGILTKEDLGGIDLTWGNVPAMYEMFLRVARREGIGDLLAEGVRIASATVGKGSEKFAIHSKGVEWGVGGAGNNRDERACYNYGMSPYGGVHHYGYTIPAQNMQAMCDSMTICTFHGRSYNWDLYSTALKAVTGIDLIPTEEEWNEIASRIIILERAWSIREGYTPDEDDKIPDRFHEEPLTLGPKAGTPAAVYPREQYERDRQSWYKERGCSEHGIPEKETLRALGLSFVIPDLEKLNAF